MPDEEFEQVNFGLVLALSEAMAAQVELILRNRSVWIEEPGMSGRALELPTGGYMPRVDHERQAAPDEDDGAVR